MYQWFNKHMQYSPLREIQEFVLNMKAVWSPSPTIRDGWETEREGVGGKEEGARHYFWCRFCLPSNSIMSGWILTNLIQIHLKKKCSLDFDDFDPIFKVTQLKHWKMTSATSKSVRKWLICILSPEGLDEYLPYLHRYIIGNWTRID